MQPSSHLPSFSQVLRLPLKSCACRATSTQGSQSLLPAEDFRHPKAIPEKTHAANVQHTCNTRATHVQHTCNTTCNTTTFPVNLQSKWLSGHFRRPKATSKGKGENFAPSRENHRNLQQKCSCCTSCCTCVARVLHVFSQGFLWGDKNPLLAAGSGSLVYKFRGRRNISSGPRDTSFCMASAMPFESAL